MVRNSIAQRTQILNLVLERSFSWLHVQLCRWYATSVKIQSSSVFFVNHYMFQPNWPSSGINVVTKNSATRLKFCFPYVITSCYLALIIVLLPCTCSAYVPHVIDYIIASFKITDEWNTCMATDIKLIDIYIYIETSVRNKCRCSFYCALLTLHVSAPIGGHLQVVL
jgi:hypothetical protein